ncbi:hypothetical protein TNCT_305721 [Trichonephila clavata]|uniref:SOCS box domain-containing protein n=1 Tax=Trichonephila clavata TaxID=2740835 RepID=A0A8X6LJN6_TRICU|nr:hypothetical protein TNCT_586791 [Trichonephila clavata]GFR10852.1 hypothetical protein TNCT_305721 [Trichonephila clavata]
MLSKRAFDLEFSCVEPPDTLSIFYATCPISVAMLNKLKINLKYFTNSGFSADEFKKEDNEMELAKKLPNLCILQCTMEFFTKESPFIINHKKIDYFSLKRKYAINKVISFFILLKILESPRREIMIQCFRYIWRANITPYVVLQEIEATLDQQKNISKCPPECFKILMSIISMYKKIFPEMADGPIRPRSLQHFCRYVIRQQLLKIPGGITKIDKLMLPSKLKSYLWLKI